ncbi:hypothetical protein GKQ38_02145 [Candidatus Nanohaloarchaea archaeon]|nr:hypothetical protein GKQ38_02145 [Candidatus Nanohaloarchaea archaeon]
MEKTGGIEDNEDIYTGFSSAAIPEAIQTSKEIFYPESQSIWDLMTDYGLDKASHFGFSYFGSKSVMKAAEKFPEYTKSLTEDREDLLSRKAHDIGVKFSSPSFQQKAGAALLGVAVLGFGKEMTDQYIDYLDMTANMTGASLGVLDEYGDGSLREGGKKAFEDINRMLSGEQETQHIADGGELEVPEEVIEQQKLLGKA